MIYRLQQVGIVVLTICLSQCGFHLRGMAPLPPSFQKVLITAPREAHFLENELKRNLEAYHVMICDKSNDSFFQIVIDKLEFQKQVSNISSSTTPRQYQLIYTVQFHFIDTAQNHDMIPNGQITSSRLVTMNNERLLGSTYEQDFFMKEMQEDLAKQMLSNISHYFQLNRVIIQ
jgi:LPS-assembly lipoprotein